MQTHAHHSPDIHEPAFLMRLFYVCAEKQNIYAVAVVGIYLGEVSSRWLGTLSGDEVRTSFCNVTFCSAVCDTQEYKLYLWRQKIQQILICQTYRRFKYSIIIIINVIWHKNIYIVLVRGNLVRIIISVSVQRVLKHSIQNEMLNSLLTWKINIIHCTTKVQNDNLH